MTFKKWCKRVLPRHIPPHMTPTTVELVCSAAELAWNDATRELKADLARAEGALEESVKLQSHYATLLNQYDGGERLQFESAQEWMDRLAALAGGDTTKARG